MSVTGERDGTPGAGPQKVGVAVTDLLTGLYTTIGALSGLAFGCRKLPARDLALWPCDVSNVARWCLTQRTISCFL